MYLNKFKNKKIILAPYNNISVNVYEELQARNMNIVAFFDANKDGEKIINNLDSHIDTFDLIIISSPNYWFEIALALKEKIKKDLYINCNGVYIKFDSIEKLKKDTFNKLLNKQTINKDYLIDITKKLSILKLLKLKNIYKGNRAFIIGNGPSLTISQLNKLENEISFACNKIFLAYPETKWRPTYYIVEDRLDIDEYLDIIFELKDSQKFIPDKFIEQNKISSDLIYYPYKYCGEHCTEFSCDISSKFNSGFSVIFTMLELAVFMGLRELYIIGVDFNYNIPNNSNDTILETQNEVNHFHKNYRKPGDKWFYPNLNLQYEALNIAKNYADKNNIQIYNATEGGKLEIFPRINFKDLF